MRSARPVPASEVPGEPALSGSQQAGESKDRDAGSDSKAAERSSERERPRPPLMAGARGGIPSSAIGAAFKRH